MSSNSSAVLEIRDTGIGFSAEEVKRQLERLTRDQEELRKQAEELAKQVGSKGSSGSRNSSG